MTTHIDTLRRAATNLREMAEAATPGPWEATTGRQSKWNSMYKSRDLRGVQRYPEREWIAHYVEPADATLVATMDPGTALALAGHLDDTATGIERRGVTARLTPAEMSAIAVARRVLGEEA